MGCTAGSLEDLFNNSSEMEHSLEGDKIQQDSDELNRRKSFSGAEAVSEYNQSSGFDCNICLNQVQDPVVTICGHLYCWPCIYKWLESPGVSSQSMDDQPQHCPVCRSEISRTDLIPLYGRGQATRNSKTKARISVPRRPPSPFLHPGTPRSVPRASTSGLNPAQELYSQRYPSHSRPHIPQSGDFLAPALLGKTTLSIIEPIVGILGEMLHARDFGNSITSLYTYPNAYHLEGSTRVRRHAMKVNKSLSRVSFFLLCCCILCLLLF